MAREEYLHSNPQLKRKLLERNLTSVVIFLLAVLPTSLLRVFDVGFQPLNAIHLVLFFVIIGLFFLKKYVKLQVIGLTMLILLVVAFLASIVNFGLVGSAHIVIPFLSIFASILFGRRVSLWFFTILSVGVSAIGALFLSGVLHYQVDVQWYLQSWTSWAILVIGQITLVLWYLFLYEPINEERRMTSEYLEAVFQGINDALFIHDKDTGAILQVNERMCNMYGYSPEEARLLNVGELSAGTPPYTEEDSREWMKKAVREGPQIFEWQARDREGRLFWVEVNMRLAVLNGAQRLLVVVRNITDRKRAEDERTGIESQLRQAQKIESVGRLAGGVAHDFNNMLGVILGYVEMALEHTGSSESSLSTSLIEIRKAAERSADLVRQLLAFARKQTIVPKVLDLNATVAGMLKMLRRLIGENIHLVWQPMVNLWQINVDPSQIDQLLANLCVNARDAITDVGKITIETGNKVIEEEFCAVHAESVPGEYVRLTVSDDGCGMDQETMSHLFEPFYTTKEIGQGTGLGLSMVYGIVKQNKGFIDVYSEPGMGTVFSIYLPRYVGEAARASLERMVPQSLRGDEIILLLEDEPSMLELIKLMLNKLGYTVLTANTPGEALHIARHHAGEIQLLITDVIMPEMSGRELADTVLSIIPRLRCLFMSGYTANAIVHHGVLHAGVHLIQKPFSTNELAAKVREVLK